MSEPQIRALFTEIADAEPARSPVDIQLARSRGRARLRWRRACMAGTSVLAAVAAVVLAVSLGAVRLGSGPASGPAAPRQFNPLVPYLSFGWLPAGNSLLAGGVRPEVTYLTAGRNIDSNATWNIEVYAAGQCHLSSPAGKLRCSTEALGGLTAQISGRAPAVRGHRAFWAGPYLVWQYARGGWAGLLLPLKYDNPRVTSAARHEAQREAVRIAAHVQYGMAASPLMFPVQLAHLPSQWRVSSVYYLPDAGMLRASRFALGTGTPDLGADGGLEYQTSLPDVLVNPSTPRNSSCGKGASEIINGYRVVLTHQVLRSVTGRATTNSQSLCAGHADGLALFIGQHGSHFPISVARLFRDHLRLLGANPANWTTKPIG